MRISINDLLPSTNYAVQVRATSPRATSEWSRKFIFTTIADLVLPKAPTNLTWVSVGDAFHAEWDAVTTNEGGQTSAVVRYELELTAGATIRYQSVPQKTDGTKVTFDLPFAQNIAIFGSAKPSISLRVRAVDNKELKSVWSTQVTATNPIPNPVTALSATGTVDTIALSWTAPTDVDLVGYYVYVGSATGFTTSSANRITKAPVNATNFTYNTSTYTKQYFKVTAVDSFGQESTAVETNATAVSPFVVDVTAPAVPSSLAATITTDSFGRAKADITWALTAPSDLAGFNIRYRKVGDINYLQTTVDKDSRSLTLSLPTPYVDYEFQIRAYDWTANYSNWSATTTATGSANAAPAQVTGLAVVTDQASLTASWTESTEDDVKNGAGTYQVDIATNSGFTTGLLTYKTGANSITVSGLSASTTYYVRVRAIDNVGQVGTYSTTVSKATTAFPLTPLTDGVAPASSPTPIIAGGIGYLFVSWAAVANADIVTYEVHISKTSGFTPSAATKVVEVSGTFASLERDAAGTALAYNTTYYVKIVAKDKDGAAPASAQASGTIAQVTALDSTLTAGDVGAPTTTQFNNLTGVVNTSIKGYVTEYAVNSSETVAPTTGWSTATPTRAAGTFVWYRVTVTYNDNTTSTTNPALLTGNTGATGQQGIQGQPGADGQSLYTWIKYADTPTTGMSDSPTGKAYMGIAVNKTTATESTTYSDYTWSLTKGDQGVPGTTGADGVTTYTWVKYADNASGGGITDDPTGKTYIGLAFNKTTQTESTIATDYTWSLIQGPQGPQGQTGATGAPAATISLTATSQALSQPATGGATTPTTSTVTGTAVNTTITAWTYSVDGGAFSATVPAGVSRAGNVVTITGSTMTAKTITVKMADANGVADTLTVARVSDGATGATGGTGATGPTGAAGADAYTVLLTNESQTFAAGTTNAVATTATTGVIAYKGSTQQSVTIGTITGGATGITASVTGSPGTSPVITFTVTTSLTAKNGTFNIPVIVGGITFNQVFAWSLSFTGSQGATGSTGATGATGVSVSSITPYFAQVTAGSAAPAKPTTATPAAPWVATEPGYVDNTELYRTEKVLFSDNSFSYTSVSKVSAYTAAVNAYTAANGKNKIVYSSGNATGTTGFVNGDIWYKLSGNAVVGFWIFNGSTWVTQTMNGAVLSSLDAGSITAGFLSSARIDTNSLSIGQINGLQPAIADRGKIYYQPTQPSIDRNALWVDTDGGNKQYVMAPKTALVYTSGGGFNADTRLAALGWNVTVVTTAPVLSDITKYSLFAADNGYGGLADNIKTLCASAFDAGVSIYTSGNDTTTMPPLFTGNAQRGTAFKNNPITAAATTHPAAQGWTSFVDSDGNYYLTGVNANATVIGETVTQDGTEPVMLAMTHATNGAMWVHNEPYNAPTPVTTAIFNWIENRWIPVQDADIQAALSSAGTANSTISSWTYSGTTNINGGKIQADTITAIEIAGRTITAAEIATGTITANEIKSNTITADRIAANTITATSGVIANAAITNAMIANLAVNTAQIADGAITNAKIVDATIQSAKIANLTADKITSGTISAQTITMGASGKISLGVGGSITVDGSTGVIKSNNYAAGSTGWSLGYQGLEVNDGSINAKTLTSGNISTANLSLTGTGKITAGTWSLSSSGLTIPNGGILAQSIQLQYGENLVDPRYADFEATTTLYDSSATNTIMSVTTASTVINTTAPQFNTQVLQVTRVGTSGTAFVNLAPTSTTYNIPTVAGSSYIASAYVRNRSAVATAVQIGIKWSNGGTTTSTAVTPTVSSNNWQRIQVVGTAPAGTTAALVYFQTSTLTANAQFDVDGVQFETQWSNASTASPWTPPSFTRIDGGLIRTGSIQSDQTIAVNGIAQPLWAINTQGSAQFGDVSVRGHLVVGGIAGGADADAGQSYMQSANYIAGTQGWIIRSDGYAEFRNLQSNSIGGDAIVAGTLDVSTISGGSLDASINLIGKIVAEGNTGSRVMFSGDGFFVTGPMTLTVNVTNKAISNGVATITTSTAHNFLIGDIVTLAGVDATLNGSWTLVDVPSSTTFTFMIAASDLASTTATGTANGRDHSRTADDPTNPAPEYIRFPTDGRPNIISGTLQANTLAVSGDETTGQAATFGGNSMMQNSATLTLNNTVNPPISAPSVTTIAMSMPLTGYSTPCTTGYVLAGGNNSTYAYGGYADPITGVVTHFVDRYDQNGALVSRKNTNNIGPWSMAIVGSTLYYLSYSTFTGLPHYTLYSTPVDAGFNDVVTVVKTDPVPGTSFEANLASDGTNLVIQYRANNSDYVRFRTITTAGVQVGSDIVTTYKIPPRIITDMPPQPVRVTSFVVGTFDFADSVGKRYIVSTELGAIYAFGPTGVRRTADEWVPTTPVQLAWDGAKFVGWSGDDQMRFNYYPGAASTDNSYWASYSYVDKTDRAITYTTATSSTTVTSSAGSFLPGDVGGAIAGSGIPAGATVTAYANSSSVTISAAATSTVTNAAGTVTPVYETVPGPKLNFPFSPRLGYKVTTNVNRATTNARIYMGHGLTAPTSTGMFYQGELAKKIYSAVYLPVFSGTTSPAATTFPASEPARILSQAADVQVTMQIGTTYQSSTISIYNGTGTFKNRNGLLITGSALSDGTFITSVSADGNTATISKPAVASYTNATVTIFEPAINLRGDGTGRIGGMSWTNTGLVTIADSIITSATINDATLARGVFTSTTDVNTSAGNAPAVRIGNIAAQHLRIDGNEIISMSDDSTKGKLSFQGARFFTSYDFGVYTASTSSTGYLNVPHNMGVPANYATLTIASFYGNTLVAHWDNGASTATMNRFHISDYTNADWANHNTTVSYFCIAG